MQRTNVHLSEAQKKSLAALARKSGLTVAEHIRRAVDEYVLRQKGAGR